MKLHQFPTPTERTRIHDLVHANACGKLSRVEADNSMIIDQLLRLYAKGLHTRRQFDTGATHTLSSAGATSITVNNYTLRQGTDIKTGIGTRPTVLFSIPEEREECPHCRGEGKYVAGKMILYCCGNLYRTKKLALVQCNI